jgi:IMP-specific 5'-nucleotidase
VPALIQTLLQGLLAVPFVLNSQPTAEDEEGDEAEALEAMTKSVHRRYAEIMRDVEGLVNDHSTSCALSLIHVSVRGTTGDVDNRLSRPFVSMVTKLEPQDGTSSLCSQPPS